MTQQVAPDPLGRFLGVWRLRRTIHDRRAGVRLRFAGTLTIRPAGGGVEALEEGLLHNPGGRPMPAGRRYLWRARGGLVEVLFADGRPFHAFDPSAASHEVCHACPPDLYRGRYDFARPPAWSLAWRVTGPLKDWTSETLAEPLAEPEADAGLASRPRLGHNLAGVAERAGA